MQLPTRLLTALLLATQLTACPWLDQEDDDPTATATPVGPGTPENDSARLAMINAQFPQGVPPAALRAAPPQPAAATDIWPFAEGISRTSGSGRYYGGAYYWTDFLYDAYGANGTPPPAFNATTPQAGSMTYPRQRAGSDGYPGPAMDDPAYHPANDPYQGNAADIFVLAVGADQTQSYWRVDWLTFAAADAAVIVFGLDVDNDANTGTAGQVSQGWPGVPNVRTAGVDAVLFVSSAGAFVRLAPDGDPIRVGEVFVDQDSHSLIAHIPHPALPAPPSAVWRIYALSGIHDGAGGVQSDPDNENYGAPTTAPPIFNVGFRDYDDESPLENNFWISNQQAQSLNSGDLSAFAFTLDWRRMGDNEAEPNPTGFSARWYRSSLGPDFFGRGGIYTADDATIHQTAKTTDDVLAYASYYDQVQPYSVWIPGSYDFANPQPQRFTLMLHSFTQNYVQYRSGLPNFQRETCDDDSYASICLTVLGRGVSGFYEFASGVDMWEAWHDVNTWFRTDPARTFTSGFSMGALGSQRLMIKHPDVFAAGIILAGAQSDQPGVADQNGNVPGCFGELQLENLKWNGYYHAAGSLDQLIPFTQQRDTVDTLKALGYRYTFDHYFNEDHVGWTIKDGDYAAFAESTDWLHGEQPAAPDDAAPLQVAATPGEIIYRFTGNDQPSTLFSGEFQLDANGAWWISDLLIADDDAAVVDYMGDNPEGCRFVNNTEPGRPSIAPKAGRVRAISAGIPEPPVTAVPIAAQFRPDMNSSQRISMTGPHNHEYQYWQAGDAPAAGGLVQLFLNNVQRIGVDLNEAGVAARVDKQLEVTSDSVFTLLLSGLTDGTVVRATSSAGAAIQSAIVVDGSATLADLPASAGAPLSVSFEE